MKTTQCEHGDHLHCLAGIEVDGVTAKCDCECHDSGAGKKAKLVPPPKDLLTEATQKLPVPR